MKIQLASDTIDSADIAALVEWLRGEPHLTKGPLTPKFEDAWGEWIGRKRNVFCNSGSSANHLMYYALKISGRLKNEKVVVPACGWATTVAPAIQFGFEPIPCDADPKTWALDIESLKRILLEHDPGAVVLVQPLGVPAAMDPIMELREKHGFLLMEDTCAAVGSRLGDRKLGTFGDLSSFSFYFGHQASTIEGGMVSTDDKELADLVLMLRAHGWSKDLDAPTHARLVKEHGIDDFNRPFVFYHPGFNFRSTDLNAFLGLRQIGKLDAAARRRAENHARYLEHLKSHLEFQTPPAGSLVASISCAALARSTEERRAVVGALAAEGVETRIFTAGNLMRHPFWSSRYGSPELPVADRLFETGFFLPNHPSISLGEIDMISEIVKKEALHARG